MKNLINQNRGVSNIVGYVIIFSVAIIVFTMITASFSVFVENKKAEVGRVVALDVANKVADGVVDAVTTIRSLSDTNYTRCINIPQHIMGKEYYVELKNGKIYVNSTDGSIKVSTTAFNIEKLGIFMSGKVYSNSGKVCIRSNKTSNVYSIDFGTPSDFELGKSSITDNYSPVEPGYIRVSNLTQIRKWNGNHSMPHNDSTDVYFVYALPIVIKYQSPPSGTTPETYPTLYDYPVMVTIPGWFPYHLVNKTSNGEPKIVFWEPDASSSLTSPSNVDSNINGSEIRPFYIEEWNDYPNAHYSSVVWVNVSRIPDTTNNPKVIYLLFCGINNSTGAPIDDITYNKIVPLNKRLPTSVFEVFDDFDITSFGGTTSGNKEEKVGGLSWVANSPNCSFYRINSSGGVESFIRLYRPSLLIGGYIKVGTTPKPYLNPVMKMPSSPPDDPTSGNSTQNATNYVLEARVRFHNSSNADNKVVNDGDILVNVNLTNNIVNLRHVGGFDGLTTYITTSTGRDTPIREISKEDAVKTVDMKEYLDSSLIVVGRVINTTNYVSESYGGLWRIITINNSVTCSKYQSFCRYNSSTGSWEWVPAFKIKVGDKLYTLNNTGKLVLSEVTYSNVPSSPSSKLYHLLTNNGNFFANGFLVHSHYTLYNNSLNGTHYFLAGIPEYNIFPESANSPTEFCLYRYDGERIGTNYTGQILSQPNINSDRWYVSQLYITNSRVKTNDSGNISSWNYSAFYAFLFKGYSNGLLVTATPMGIDTSEDVENWSDPPGGPFFGGNIGIGYGLLSDSSSSGSSGGTSGGSKSGGIGGGSSSTTSLDLSSYMDVDWIRLRKSSSHVPSATVMSMSSSFIGWWNITDIHASYNNSTINFLTCDLNNCTEKKNFGMYISGGGEYTITVTMGDTDHNHTVYVYYQIDDGNYTYGIGPVKLNKSEFVMRSFKVNIPDGLHILNVSFSTTPLDSNGNPLSTGTLPPPGVSWVVNALTVDKGFKGVRLVSVV